MTSHRKAAPTLHRSEMSPPEGSFDAIIRWEKIPQLTFSGHRAFSQLGVARHASSLHCALQPCQRITARLRPSLGASVPLAAASELARVSKHPCCAPHFLTQSSPMIFSLSSTYEHQMIKVTVFASHRPSSRATYNQPRENRLPTPLWPCCPSISRPVCPS